MESKRNKDNRKAAHIPKDAKQRDSCIDMIKGIAILAVVLLHINFNFTYGHFTLYWILGGLWHVAVFFVISGWFLKDERMLDIKQFVWGKAKGLMVKAMYIHVAFVILHNLFFRIGWLFSDIEYGKRLLQPFDGASDVIRHLLMQFVFLQREPFAGAMWFVDSLFLGLSGYCLITKFLYSRFSPLRFLSNAKDMNIEHVSSTRLIVCLLIAVASAFTHKMGMDIPKVSNTCSVILLICTGQLMGQRHLEFNNKFVFVGALALLLHHFAQGFKISLVDNDYPDVVTLVTIPTSAIYIMAFIFKKTAMGLAGKIIKHVGKESFWIMGLHMIGFHVFTSLMESFGFQFGHHFTTPQIGHNIVMLVGYFTFGIIVPIIIKETVSGIYHFIHRR